jgi:D-amino-acid oxidase
VRGALRGAAIDAAEPVRVGLRPFRRKGVRLEQEAGTRVVHNYGHGGSGVTYSWGCGSEVVELVEKLLLGGVSGRDTAFGRSPNQVTHETRRIA